mmetsp:Transcript_27007/g.59061  ORF Transcript_27007/g.59061 Transcript_27007/m.59061 type:complete len:1042 (+) Transcript_27007:153-3278(+)|eukprot:CAMPEP_0202918548 /NCGR_PEP_ID=MMETSP1392-20130828/73706_1 /ASSEMBLY_ACC=CAM_ASM_000868 /TAXON_ID=225041 /ORGANISM="Chlamydomonas chlamydogama, Strain SAG 11-48b" /LENGTH=1041 /DNA_ID=CAMNT_0049611643 /DNA_START=83 /DNA_END=3208 /DNA_ORIENTATION=-
MAETHEGVNVQVLLRCRPLSEKEVLERTPQVITCNDVLREVTLYQNAAGKSHTRTFRFDKVFGPDSTQEKLFKQAVVPIVQEVMDGFNCTIFAYGQTGTGKTYTMEGGPRESTDGRKLSAEAGVIPRSIKQIFDTIEANNMDSTVKVSFLELYNEELTDLLSFDDDKDISKKLRLLEDRSGVNVQGLEEVIVRSAAEIYQVLDRGTAKRRTAATLLNNRSSRSHSIFTITIHLKETTPEGEDVIKVGKLNLVDLAGSENISRSGAKDSRAREAGSINQSLLTLGRVITALVEHSGHIPYRDSKLTRLLRDSLGGRTKTCIIATIAPTVQCQEETISTLDYAHRAKNIRNRPEVNQKISKTTMIKEMAAEIEKLKLDLVCTREKNGVYLSMERYEQNEMERLQLRETVKALKAELEESEQQHEKELEGLNTSHAREVETLQSELAAAQRELADVHDRMNEAHATIQERQFMILSHQRAEHALAAHANQLTSELAACASDIGALFRKLEEVAALQGADRSVMQSTRGYVQARIQDLGSTVEQGVNLQKQHLTAACTDLAAFKQQKEQDIKQLQDQMQSIQNDIRALQTGIGSQLDSMRASVSGTFNQATAGVESYSCKLSAAAETFHGAAQQALVQLSKSIEAQAHSLVSFTAKQSHAAEESLRSIKALAESATNTFSGLANEANQLRSDTSQQFVAIDSSLSTLAKDLVSSMDKQQAALVEQVNSLIRTFASQQAAQLSTAMQQIRQQCSDDGNKVSDKLQELSAAAKLAAGDVQSHGGKLVSSVETEGRQQQQLAAECANALKQFSEQGAASASVLDTQLAEQKKLVADLHEGFSCLVKSSMVAFEEASVRTKQKAEASTNKLLKGHDEMGAGLRTQHAADMALVNSVLQLSAEASQCLDATASKHRDTSSAAADNVNKAVTDQLSKQVAMHDAPAKRQVAVPEPSAVQELMCPPEEVVLQQYRKEMAQILRRGGDVKQVNMLVNLTKTSVMGAIENQPGSPVSTMKAPSSPPKSAAKVVRSRIPGVAAVGLVDRTNRNDV